MKKWFILITLMFFGVITEKIDTTEATSVKQKEYLVYIDAGHGGRDGGASSIDGIEEKHINLSISTHLGNFLKQNGIKVEYIRTGDYHLASDKATNKKREDLHKRVNLINNSKADLYISIHCNAITNSKWNGPQIFYNDINNKNEVLAEKIQTYLNAFTNKKRNAKKIRNIYLIDNVKTVGALVEVGFLSNVEEAKKLSDNAYQQAIAHQIALSLLDYLYAM